MAKSWQIEGLNPEQSLAQSARLIIVTKFREAFSYREALFSQDSVDTVHDMRVSLRRLWAAMHSFSGCFEHVPEFRFFVRRTRKLADKLGAVRDLDVLMEILQSKAQQFNLDEPAVKVTELAIEYCREQRNKQHKRLQKYLQKLIEEDFEAAFLKFFLFAEENSLSIGT
jgi:CHAD domain-containing protein